MRLILFLAFGLLLWLGLRWLRRRAPSRIIRVLHRVLLWLGGGLLVGLILSGQVSLLFILLVVAAPIWAQWAMRQTAANTDNSAPAEPIIGAMSREEALSILGLSPGADAQAIGAAHRRLIQRLHPDRGGSTWLAAKINRAKQVLLEGN